jgi:hypothetical protein
MMGFSPVTIAFLIVICVAIVGTIAGLIRRASVFSGYRDVAADARKIALSLKGEINRERSDLVISGNCGRLPATVRFSRADDTPGLNIRMEAPATFSLSVSPRGDAAGEGRYALRTSDESFDIRYTIRSNHPTQARMFLGGRRAFAALQRLCSSGSTFLTISQGAVELSELAFPSPPAARRIEHLLQAMGELAEELKAMPGAHTIEIRPRRRGGSLALRAAMAAGGLVAILGVLAASRQVEGTHAIFAASAPSLPPGFLPVDAAKVSNLQGWRVAVARDFHPDAVGWLRSYGIKISGRIEGDFAGTGALRDAAYILIDQQGKRRLVLLAGGHNRFDTGFESIAVATRVPKANVAAIKWADAQPPEFDGDGLLLVRAPADHRSGIVLFLKGSRIVSAIPKDYQTINLTE